MLKSHFDAVENSLLARSRIPANSGHTIHKGTPREEFISEFLQDHLSESVAISSGEIIDSDSKPNEKRNQIDIVVYRRDYPKLKFSRDINAFLAESVVATIEVKSILDRDGLEQSIKTARNTKNLKRSLITPILAGYPPPSILNYVVAYDGPARIQTVDDWIGSIHDDLAIESPPIGATRIERFKASSPSVDAVFILGKGFIHFDNTALSFMPDQARAQDPNLKWAMANTTTGNLFLLFLFLTQASIGTSGGQRLHPTPYVADFGVTNTSLST